MNQSTDNINQSTNNINQSTDNINQSTDNINQSTDNINQSTDNINKRIFTNIDHLKSTVKTFGSTTFKDVTLSDRMLQFIINNFISSQFLKNGKVLGDLSTPKIADLNESEKLVASNQKKVLAGFLKILVSEHLDQTIHEPNINDPIIGSGSYGTITEFKINGTIIPNRLVKFMSFDNEDEHEHELSIHPEIQSSSINSNSNKPHNRYIIELYAWMIEFSVFVIIMSILAYVDSIIDQLDLNSTDDRKQHYKQLFDYRSMFARICKPFIKKTSNDHFVLGYIIERYDKTIEQVFENTENDIYSSLAVLVQSVVVLRKLLRLSEFGVYISHRDTTARNIMTQITNDGASGHIINLIDFGFLCVNIKFRDSYEISAGYHPFDNRFRIDTCDKRHIDLILFITWCIRHCTTTLKQFHKASGVDIIKQFTNIITLNNSALLNLFNKKKDKDKNKDYYSPWEYSCGLDQFVNDLIKENKIDQKYSLNHTSTHHDRVNLMFNDILQVMYVIVDKLSARPSFSSDSNNELSTKLSINNSDTNKGLSTKLSINNSDTNKGLSTKLSFTSDNNPNNITDHNKECFSSISVNSTDVNNNNSLDNIAYLSIIDLYEHNKQMYLQL